MSSRPELDSFFQSFGTVLLSRTGRLYFNLYGRNQDQIVKLKDLLDAAARNTGAVLEENRHNPLTLSPGVYALKLEMDHTQSPQYERCQRLRQYFVGLGNVFDFPYDEPKMLFNMQGMEPTPLQAVDRIANTKLLALNAAGDVVPTQRALLDYAKYACHVAASYNGNILDNAVAVPVTTYDMDTTKSYAVSMVMKHLATHYKEPYSIETAHTAVVGDPVQAHHVRGSNTADYISKLGQTSDVMLGILDEIKPDMARFSSASSKLTITDPNAGKGILEAAGINPGTSSDHSFMGIPLMGQAPR